MYNVHRKNDVDVGGYKTLSFGTQAYLTVLTVCLGL